ncbi:NB-ARC domain-containing protein [Methylicorpusculum sp.]|uniref:NB-ARC domain-containing protein n=1 Tax=Methylicorpusculum sp. TaxID=2713644 RepID=UPI002ABB5066|nr:NB-ARC domain-containing protein [Methylicorpusculum sp.]MDZ4151907.1 NB-ARC domain-containing protein [Methylicorpusculum sp.]
MAEQAHYGPGDNIAGNQTKIDRQTTLGPNSAYYENPTIIQPGQKIERYLTNPPFVPPIFQGRETVLEAIYHRLKTDQGSQLLLLVNGEGGIGKTSLAAKYWQRYQKEYHHLAWLFCSGSWQETLLTLAAPLQLVFPEAMPGEERLPLLLQKLANLPEPCLLVLDNANDIAELKQNYLALSTCSNCHILLTTRITQFEQAPNYSIPPLPTQDALTLFKTHYPKHRLEDDGLFTSIFKAVGGNTLVLEVLAKNLTVINTDEISYSLADLLKDLQQRGLLHLSQTEAVSLARKGPQANLVEATPTDILMALYSDLEMVVPLTEYEPLLLSNLAVLPAEKLAFSLLKELLSPEDSKAFSKTLAGLAQRGWLERFEENANAYYKISPVVQEITRYKNQATLQIHCATLIANLIEKLAYQPGIGHLLNASYAEGALYSRYGEAVLRCFHAVDSELGLLCDRIGYYHKTTGNLELALTYFQQDYRLATALYADYPNDEFYKNYLALTCERLGSTTHALGQLETAQDWYQQSYRLEQELFAAFPGNVDFKNNLDIACQHLGITASALGQLETAQDWYLKSYRLAQELFEAFPGNVAFKNGLAIACQYLGITASALGQLETAQDWYQQYYRLEQELFAAFPGNVDFKNNLAIACQYLGNTASALGQLETEQDWYQQYYRLAQELFEAFPGNVTFKNRLAIACPYLGNTASALGQLETAQDWYQQFHRLEQELFAAFPGNVDFKSGLAIACQKLGSTASALGQLETAQDWYQQYYRLEQELFAAFPGNVAFKNGLANACQYLGITASALGQLEAAQDWHQQSYRLEQELFAAFPGNVAFKNGLALSCQWLGWTLEKLEQEAQAVAYYQQSQHLLEQFAADSPGNIEFKQNLDWVNKRLAELDPNA